MAISTLQEKFIHGLGDIYDAEQRFLEAQQKMLKQASNTTVQSLLNEHITQTKQQIENLNQVYQSLNERPKRIKCDAAVGLVTEGEKELEEVSGQPALLDCVIAGAASKVEHYEIASYRGLIACAAQLGLSEPMRLLQQNLQQEEQTAARVEQSIPQLLQMASGMRERAR